MSSSDLAGVFEIEQGSFPSPWSMRMLQEELELGHSISLVVEEGGGGGKLDGYIFARTVADEMHIVNVAVNKKARRRGLATMLIEVILERSRATGVKYVYLEVRTTNLAAIRLYEKFGFRILRMRSRYYEDSSDAYEMALVLDDSFAIVEKDDKACPGAEGESPSGGTGEKGNEGKKA